MAAGKIDAKVPDIGDYEGVPVIEVLVKDGDRVEKDAPLIVLESEKATMEVPAPAAGVVRGLKPKVGDKVSQGDLVCALEGAAEIPAEATPTAAPATKSVAAPAPVAAAPAPPLGGTAAHAGPATRKFARELGADLSKVPGT